MSNEILLSDTLSLKSTLMGESRGNIFTDVTKSYADYPKGTTDDKKRNDKQNYHFCQNSPK